MGLFGRKKVCDICGGEIGLLGNRKLADGNCCKNCAAKLSPWMTDRKESTIEEIRDHLAYREENKDNVAAMNPTAIYGHWRKIYIDPEAGCFCIASSSDWRRENPDVVPFEQVADVKIDIDENKRELYDKDAEGKQVRFNPPRYEYSYSFDIIIYVNSPYFDRMSFTLSDDKPESRISPLYFDYERQADEIRMMLMPGCEPIGSYIAYEAEAAARAAEAAQAQMRAEVKAAAASIKSAILGAAARPQSAATVGAAARPQAAAAGNAARPVRPQPAEEEWLCSCGKINTGNFCRHCGAKKPAGRLIRCDKCGWMTQTTDMPRFCPKCGDPITFADIRR